MGGAGGGKTTRPIALLPSYLLAFAAKGGFDVVAVHLADEFNRISLGQTASHSYWLVQAPKSSLSMASTIFSTRLLRSGCP